MKRLCLTLVRVISGMLIFTNLLFAQQYKIMPLGDSITAGVTGSDPVGGFRDDLYSLLVNEGISFDFVGSQSDGDTSVFDADHEGHGGWRADWIDDNIVQWLNDYNPDIVLLHIGTNDINQDQSIESTISDIESIIEKIHTHNSSTWILICSLIPRTDDKDSLTTSLNSLIEEIFYNKRSSGYKIYYVGQNEVFKTNPNWQQEYMSDATHPNNTGYNVMAQVYFNAIMNIINSTDLSVTDNFERTQLGITWGADPEFQINNGKLTNTAVSGWDHLAIYKAQVNPTEVSLRWAADADPDGISNGGLALMLNSTNPNEADGYLVWITSDNKLVLWTIVDGAPGQPLGPDQPGELANGPSAGDEFKVMMTTDAKGHHFDYYINGQWDGRRSDPNALQGNASILYSGVMLKGGYNNNIDDFSIFKRKDTTPPAAVTDLTVASVTASTVTLRWHAPGDDGDSGRASTYDIRYSINPISESNFAEATQVNGEPVPSDPGTLESFTVTGLQPSTTYYFALKTADEVPNWSPLSNVVWTETTSGRYIVDHFDRDALGPDWAADPAYQISGGELSNTSNDGWNDLAVYLARKNPMEVSFVYSPNATDLDKCAIALLLDQPSTNASGYAIWRRTQTSQIYLWGIVNGQLDAEAVARVDAQLPSPQPGDIFKVVIRSDDSGYHFDCYINDQYDGTATDPNKSYGSIEDYYAGVMLYGQGGDNNIDDFTLLLSLGPPASLVIHSGDGQFGTVMDTLASPLVVQVTDENDNPLSGVSVHFQTLQGGGYIIGQSTGVYLRKEAEYGNLTSPMQITSDQSASNESCIIAAGENGVAEFPFQISEEGDYVIWTRILAPGRDKNSLFVSFDGGSEFRWDSDVSNTWIWDRIGEGSQTDPKIFHLTTGSHTLKLRNGPDYGMKIDVLILTTDMSFQPSGMGQIPGFVTNELGLASAQYVLGSVAGPNVIQAWIDELPGVTVEFTATALPDVPATIQKTGGDGQSGYAGDQLPDSLEVTVCDQYNNPTPNVDVTFTVTQGGGYLNGTPGTTTKVVPTDNFGKARVSLTLGGEHPTNIVEASVGGLPPVQFTATAHVGSPAELHYVSGDSLSGVVSNPLPEPFKVKVADEYGGGVEGHPVTFTVVAGGGNFNGNPSVTVQTDSNGIAQATLTLGPNVGVYNNIVEASASYEGDPLAGSPITFGASATYTRATKLVYLSGSGQTGPAGEPLPQPFKVKTTDDNDQPISGHPVTFKVTAGSGTLDGDTVKTVLSNEDGIAQVILTLGPQVGTDNNVVEASSTSDGVHPLAGSPITFTASATVGLPSPEVSTITVDPDTLSADGSSKATITVTLKDAGGNPVPNKAVILFSTGSDNNIGQPLYLTDENGQTHGYISSTKAELKTIRARDVTDGIDLTTTAKVLFVPLAASRIAMVSGNDQTGNIGTVLPESLVVMVTDIHGNPIPNYGVTFAVTEGKGSIVEPQPVYTDSAGYASAHLILDQTPGINRVEAQAPGLEGSPVKFIATGVEATATDIRMVRGDGQTGVAGRTLPVPLEVEVTDAAGNPVWGFPVTFEVALGNGSVSDSVDVTDAYGRASTYLTLDKTVGLNVVKAIAPGLSGSPVTFMAQGVSGSPAMIMAMAGENQEGRAGSSLPNPLVVKVTDIYGNPVEGVEVTFTVVQGEASIAEPQPQTTDENGKASTSVNLGTTLGTVIIKASSPGLEGSPVQFTARIIASSPAKMEILSGNEQKGTIGRELVFPLEVLVTDAYDNPVPGVSITFVVTGGGGSLIDGQYVTTDENGVASNRWVLGPNPGYNEVVALKTGLSGSPLTFTATGETNHYPIFADINDTTVYKDQLVEFTVTATDDDGDPLTYGARNLPPAATFDSTGTRIFRWLPNANHIGKHTVRFVVFDDKGGFDVEDVVITVRKKNQPPQIVSYSPQETLLTVYWSEHDTLLFSVEATDPDGDPLTYRWINYWSNDSLIVSRTNTYVLRAENNTAETHFVKVEISDLDTTISQQWCVSVKMPVKLTSFVAEVIPYQGIRLSWETEIEMGNVGFNILKSTSKDGHYRQINPEIIFSNRMRRYSFLDEKVKVGEVYFYKLEDVSFNGYRTQHGPIRVEVSRPDDCALSQNYPNPFNPDTKINYRLPESDHVIIKIFNILGQEVKTLVDEQKEAGYHTVCWDGRDKFGRELPSGVYYYQIKVGRFTQTRRMILMR